MSNQLYGKGLDSFLDGSYAWLSDNFKIIGVTSAYSVAINTDQFKSDVPGGDIVCTSGNLASTSHSLGIASAANTTWSAVTGSTISYIVLYKDTGTAGTSRLILYIDTASSGLPVTPNGGDITVQWSSGQVFQLCEGLKEKDRGLLGKLADWFNDVVKIPADLTPSGLWIPRPAVIQGAPV